MSAPPRPTAEDYARAITLQLEITEAALPGVKWRDEGHNRRFMRHGGFLVNRNDGGWYDCAAAVGHYSSVKLIQQLKGYSEADATQHVLAFLNAHPETGSCTGQPGEEPEDSAGELANKATAEDIGKRLIAAADSETVSKYLRSRALPGPYPSCVKALENARVGEAALVGELTYRGRVVGYHCTYLGPSGGKSLVKPTYACFMLEKAPGAVFDIPGQENE